MKKVEVFILSGFLGSGKTTLLKNILTQEKENKRKVAVVMNELGQVSIDSNAVSEDTPLKELLNGCVCCTIQGQFEVQLQELLQDYELDSIYIETTGVAHPIEVLDACMSPLFASKLTVQGIVTIIDANRWKDRHTLTPQFKILLQEQIKHADVLILNKVEQLTEKEQAQNVFEIQSLNNQAKCLLTSFASVQLDDIRTYQTLERKPHEKTSVAHLHVKTYVHTFSGPIDIDIFEEWLRSMPESIYRIKGYLKFLHSKHNYSFQYSYGTPIYMKELMNYPLTLVFIGEELDPVWMKAEMNGIETKSIREM
ncbi:CobW family GTP-binding protein [Ferdinandcohnia quinoae]|uniref:GTP-binding protein n=1 Tax=Fredinandcohnia quinoae TaxID=2918902 RepID=A0AAW5EAR9_9BACI|nr:GTP-binding protein [Fredinandcohnia sp. SECRCQ15]MCH1626977.1 GTP-binding protein [Fredinandcohnia sp. SECRCQ15]